ncbi:anthranilate phosphoribosyltransferase [Pontiella sulfatireligans]|uniref:Anthranilate phosphoribosyltransferase n=1 Tax=Pontiella sulfatireligans TaxID=2750658 RepID=A0A6C2UIN8_9BACT|nr:anthranilate phosphoribosyltransferase [Pontiella sulfatireligans]VGO19978.1 Anthranilate phosphoribosyltransferase [Pontiella sulfatireligans]
MIKEAIAKLISKEPLSRAEAAAAMTNIMAGNATEAQIGAFIAGLRLTGETPETIAGCAEVMRANATKIQCDDPNAVDIVGTGGDGAHTFNISTTAAFVIAGAGVTVAKHGSYGVSSKCGSANVLSELGVNIQYTPQRMEECLAELGIAFLFAPGLHPAMKHVIGPRRELGIWSIFNILGPLCNPAGVKNGIMGVFKPELVPIVSDACAQLDMNYQFIVHGNDGLDEFTTTTTTMVTEIRRGKVESYEVQPAGLGLPMANASDLIGGEPSENAELTYALLRGEKGPKRDIVLLNAAFAIMAGGKADNPKDGIALAAESIDSGAALKKLESLAKMSHG